MADIRYRVDDELGARLEDMARCDDLVDLMLALRDMDAMVTERVRLARSLDRVDALESEHDRLRAREDFVELDEVDREQLIREATNQLVAELEARGATFAPEDA